MATSWEEILGKRCLQNQLAVLCQSAPNVHIFRKPLVFNRSIEIGTSADVKGILLGR